MKKTTTKKSGCKCAAKPAAAPAEKPAEKVALHRVTFTYRAEPGSTVSVAGDFNEWDPAAKVLEDKEGTGLYKAIVRLAPGTYEYKFVVNGTWCVDPDCKDWVQNAMGTLNSVLRVE